MVLGPRIYGWGPPNAGVTVTTSDGQRVTEDVDGSGNFSVMLPPRQAQIVPVGVSITVAAGGKSITLDDVLFGDVWVCSGQVPFICFPFTFVCRKGGWTPFQWVLHSAVLLRRRHMGSV